MVSCPLPQTFPLHAVLTLCFLTLVNHNPLACCCRFPVWPDILQCEMLLDKTVSWISRLCVHTTNPISERLSTSLACQWPTSCLSGLGGYVAGMGRAVASFLGLGHLICISQRLASALPLRQPMYAGMLSQRLSLRNTAP